jgi:hypothetical protein
MTSLAENRDRRVFGAIRLVDEATGVAIDRPLRVTGNGMRIIRNLSKLYVIFAAPGLDVPGQEPYVASFAEPPALPAPGTVEINLIVEDPGGRFLPRTTTISLPRNPQDSPPETFLFKPVDIVMHRAPAAALRKNWSAIRVSLQTDAAGKAEPVAGAMIRVIRSSDNSLLARGLTDRRGEGLVIVPGIPFCGYSESGAAGGAVISRETAVHLELIVSPQKKWPPDPDQLEDNRDNWRVNEDQPINLELQAGKAVVLPPVSVMTI